MPAGLRSAFKPTSKYNWWYYTQAQKHLNNRNIQQPRGKVLGGSSSINGMTWLRGHPLDYDRWQSEGAAGWDWASCLPYFKKSENSQATSEYRGQSGLMYSQVQKDLSPLNAAFLAAGQEAGFPLTEDVNGFQIVADGIMGVKSARGKYSTPKPKADPAEQQQRNQATDRFNQPPDFDDALQF